MRALRDLPDGRLGDLERQQARHSQLTLPQPAAAEVYATSGYAGSAANLANVSLATDMVFADGATLETPTVSGSVDAGYVAALTVGVTL